MAALIKAIEQHIPYLRSYARSIAHNPVMAEDLLQECLTRAMAKRETFTEGTNLRAWLCTILHNLYINELRRTRRWGVPVDPDDAVPSLSRPADQETNLLLRAVLKAMERMPNERGMVLYLVGVEGMSYNEASDLLKLPVGTVKSRVSRARQQLRRHIDEGQAAPAPHAA